MQFLDVTAEYSRVEAWAYDRFTAPALSDWIASRLLDPLLEEVPEGGSVLDVGCGGGYLPLAVNQKRPDLNSMGLDLSADLIQWAAQRSESRNSTARFLRGNALSLPFAPNSIDLVLSVGSIKHWPNREQGLKECIRVLKPGSTFCVLEADPAVSWKTAWKFIGQLNFPAPLRLPFLPYFKYVVAGEGLSTVNAEELLHGIDCSKARVDTLNDRPLVRLQGKK